MTLIVPYAGRKIGEHSVSVGQEKMHAYLYVIIKHCLKTLHVK